jgi:transcriptional regulator with XRE-family HTH domain
MVLKRRIHLIYTEKILIGKVIERLRRQRGLNQDELASDSGISREFMNRIATNKSEPGLGTIFALADGLDMKPSELVKIIEESPDTEFEPRKKPKPRSDE